MLYYTLNWYNYLISRQILSFASARRMSRQISFEHAAIAFFILRQSTSGEKVATVECYCCRQDTWRQLNIILQPNNSTGCELVLTMSKYLCALICVCQRCRKNFTIVRVEERRNLNDEWSMNDMARDTIAQNQRIRLWLQWMHVLTVVLQEFLTELNYYEWNFTGHKLVISIDSFLFDSFISLNLANYFV